MNYNFHPYFTKEFELTPALPSGSRRTKRSVPLVSHSLVLQFFKKQKWKGLDMRAKISQTYLMSNMDPAPLRKCLYFLDSDQIKGYRDDL